jgi:type III secretory pathway component EscR
VILFVVLGSIALIYLIQILRDIRDISHMIKSGLENASDHIEELLNKIMENKLVSFFLGKKKVSKKSAKKEEVKSQE